MPESYVVNTHTFACHDPCVSMETGLKVSFLSFQSCMVHEQNTVNEEKWTTDTIYRVSYSVSFSFSFFFKKKQIKFL